MKGAASSRGLAVISVSTIAAAAAVTWSILHWKLKKASATKKDEPVSSPNTDEAQTYCQDDDSSSVPLTEIHLDTSKTHDDNVILKAVQVPNTISICYASVTGTCTAFAKDLYKSLSQASFTTASNSTVQLCTVDQIDWWEELLTSPVLEESKNSPSLPPIVLFILPTWTQGTLPEPYSILLTSIQEILTDWRVAPQPLRHKDTTTNTQSKGSSSSSSKRMKHPATLRVASFGIGSSAYNPDTFCKPAKDVFTYFMKLGAHSLLVGATPPIVGMGDVEVGNCAETSFQAWKQQVMHHIQRLYDLSSSNGMGQTPASTSCCNSASSKGDGKDSTSCSCMDIESPSASSTTNSKKAVYHDAGEEKINYPDTLHEEQDLDAIYEDDEEEDEDDDDEPFEAEGETDILDLEDLGDLMKASSAKNEEKDNEPKEMLTAKQAAALKKEGYRIIGTHSAVKLCRWTKHQLRGRGGCYKHTFYGITSYQCMEATPSLACANKCVFCWRHHKNPVGKEWTWKTDDPYFIVDQAIQLHISMIREAKGIPGVVAERWREAHTVRHCALSLVGEPIMYPRINELLGELHRRSISTFLVTNGQHPHAIETVIPVTQLYVSVDASTPETLEAIDRPLFSDAWDRLCSSLTSLKNRGQRTVARLTVVKGWNADEIEGYAKLIALGHCSFVEVKGVTFCGKSDASNLNMSNSPYHHEVVTFSKKLVEILSRLRMDAKSDDNCIPEYDVACEHKHSCSVLIARVDLFGSTILPNGRRAWRTWIDYDKFNQLVMRYAADPTFTFTANDYSAETPTWALSGAVEEGFDPQDGRYRKKSKFPKYTQYDEDGVPTHDELGNELNGLERQKLRSLMEKKKAEIGDGQSITYSKDGSKRIEDASLMFRGMTVNDTLKY